MTENHPKASNPLFNRREMLAMSGKAAMAGLAERGDAEMRQRLVDLYWEESTNDRERTRILMLILQKPADGDFPVLSDALTRDDTDIFTRQSIAHLYGRIGDASVLPALKESMTVTSDPDYQGLAKAAIQTIESRLESEQGSS